MSVTVTIEMVRPHRSTPWFLFDRESHANYFSSLVASNTFSYTQTLSEDELTQTRTFVFADQAAADALFNDPVLAPGFAARETHNAMYGISLTRNTVVD